MEYAEVGSSHSLENCSVQKWAIVRCDHTPPNFLNRESGGTVYALVLGTSTERFKSSNLFSRTIFRSDILRGRELPS